MDKIKMAVFGLNQGARIARLFKENDEVELTAVAGFGQQAIDVASEVGAKLYEDYNDLLANETLDGVAIALPNSLHLSATKACCEAGIKNILLEKPIANTPEEGQAIIDCCNEHNATLLIGHHRRSSNLFLFLKEFLATGKLGDIIGIQSSFAIAKEKHYWDAEWHKEPEGAILLVNAIHDLDDLNNVLNMKATRVYAAKRNTIRGYNAEDSVSALFEFEGGATATYFISDGTPSGRGKRTVGTGAWPRFDAYFRHKGLIRIPVHDLLSLPIRQRRRIWLATPTREGSIQRRAKQSYGIGNTAFHRSVRRKSQHPTLHRRAGACLS